MTSDEQLRGIRLADVLEKRRLDQALNAKEFAVCAGISYSIARNWFRMPGFPAIRGVVFWQDFGQWRTQQQKLPNASETPQPIKTGTRFSGLPPRAVKILHDAR